MALSLPDPRAASRVIRTVHQVLLASLFALPGLVVVFDLPADKVAGASTVIVAVAGGVAKVYNRLWPAQPPLDEDPAPQHLVD